MANFTTEAALRLRLQLEDTNLASTELVEGAIADAHAEILARIDPAVDTQQPEELLVLGETLLAGAGVLRALATKYGSREETVVVGGQRVESGKWFSTLMALAGTVEKRAWRMLEAFMAAHAGCAPAEVTETTPVLGTEDRAS